MKLVKSLMLCLALFGFATAAHAADVIGVIDAQAVFAAHPKLASVQEQVAKIVEAKQKEAQAAIEKASTDAEKANIYNQKRMESAQEEQKLMEPILKDLDNAVRVVAKNKGLTMVIDKSVTLLGGLDITQDVIQELKKSAK